MFSGSLRLYLIALATIVVVAACDRIPLTSPSGSAITVSIDREVLPLNGQATVRAIVIESSGTPVHNGTEVTFQASIGTVNPPTVQTVNGVAISTYHAGTLSGTGFVHAFSGGIRTGSGNASGGGAPITIGAAAARGMAVTATPPNISQSGGTVTISATVFDGASNPLPGVNVQFTASTGTLSQTTALSNSNGIALTTLATSQTSTVTAFAGSAKGEVQVTVSTAPTVTIDPPTPASPVVGVPMAFTVTASSGTTAAPKQIRTLDVDFGDGFTETRQNVTGSAAFAHTYNRAGAFTITARATDVDGNMGVASRAIIVGTVTPTVAVVLSDTTPQVNQIIGFTITGTPGTGGPPIASVRAFVDGELVFSASGSSGAFQKGFSAQGTYLLEVQAIDTAGNIGRNQQFITVTP